MHHQGECMNIDLSDKRVIVTGASRGIGKAIATAFAAEGASVAICARNLQAVTATGQELEASASAAIAHSGAVTDTTSVNAFVAEVTEAAGAVGVLVDNADPRQGGNLDTLTAEAILGHANA